jgi:hypothetical protein
MEQLFGQRLKLLKNAELALPVESEIKVMDQQCMKFSHSEFAIDTQCAEIAQAEQKRQHSGRR